MKPRSLKENEKISLTYGVLADPPEAQLKGQGHTLKGYAKQAEKMLDALYTLRLSAQLPDGMYTNILNRIHKKITNAIQKA